MKKDEDKQIISTEFIESSIYVIRGCKVMLDSDLAKLYGIPTKRLNEQVKRNVDRFPGDFMFSLNQEELNYLELSRSQFATLKNGLEKGNKNLRSQIATSSLPDKEYGGRRYLPCAFTEQGVAMLSSVLRSSQAISVNIEIMRAFVKMRHFFGSQAKMTKEIDEIKSFLLKNSQKNTAEFKKVWVAIDALANPRVERKIGFRLPKVD